jgi:hypothetical protein
LTINGTTYDLSANRSWTIAGTAAVWGNISGTLSNQTDLQNALNAKYNNPTGTISQYIRGDGTIANFPTIAGGLPTGGTAGQILAKIDATDYNAHWIDNYATQTKNEVKLGQTLTKGTPVYVSSANGTNMIVSAASNTSEALSSKTFGLLETGGATNAFVKCVTFGLLAGLDTSTAQAGDPVWLGVNGALIFGLANKPYAPAHLVYIGVVTRVQQNNGEIFVNVQNGFELKEIHDVYIADPANNHGLFYDLATGLWKNKSIVSALGYTPQAQLNGTGFVKASGTTITYDNSTYLTTTDAASTYQRLDKMVSNLLASATEYPNSNAVINALALKADALNPVFTGYMTISGAEPKLYFTDTDQNPDYFIGADAGFFRIYDQTAGATRFVINSSGVTTIAGDLIVGTIAKSGGTATQFLKADGSIDSSTYVTSASLANYLLISTAASTYQRLDKMVSNLLASDTEYPNSNAVLAKLALKADAANPVFTGDMTISGIAPKLYFTDTDNNPDYTLFVDSGYFYIYDQTAGATKFQITPSGNAINTGTLTSASFIKSGGTSSQYLMADGSVTTGPNLSGYVPYTGATTNVNLGTNSITSSSYARSLAGTGYLNGKYEGVETTVTTGPIYCLGDSYAPTSTTLNTMYGIGYSYNNFTGAYGPANTWGMYVAGGGSAGVFLTEGGFGYFKGKVLINTTTDAGYKLDVNGTGRFSGSVTINASATNGLILQNASGGESPNVTFITPINRYNIDANAVGILRFFTENTDGTGGVVRATIDSNGAGMFISSITAASGIFNNGANSTDGIKVISTTSSSVFTGGIEFIRTTVSGGSKIQPLRDAAIGGVGLNFLVTANNTAEINATYTSALQILNTGAATFASSVTAGTYLLSLGQLPAIVGSSTFMDYISTNISRFASTSNATNTYAAIVFSQYSSNGSLGRDAIYINPSGNVSIGTLSSFGKLNVNVDAAAPASSGNMINGFTIHNTVGGRAINLGVNESGAYNYIQSSYVNNADVAVNLALFTGSTERVRITSLGTAIGTTAPILTAGDRGNLTINGSVASILTLASSGTFNTYIYSTSSFSEIYSTPKLWLGTNGSTRISIETNGNILIGTTTDAGYKLFVNGTTAAASYGRSSAGTGYLNGKYSGVENTNTTGPIYCLGDPYVPTATSTGSMYGIGYSYNSFTGAYGPANDWGMYVVGGGTVGVYLSAGGNGYYRGSITATSFFESSDFRLKTLINDNPIIHGIEHLEAKLYEKNGKIELGYFAQDAEIFMPYAVTKNADGFLNLSYREVHTAKIARLEKEVAELKAKLNAA